MDGTRWRRSPRRRGWGWRPRDRAEASRATPTRFSRRFDGPRVADARGPPPQRRTDLAVSELSFRPRGRKKLSSTRLSFSHWHSVDAKHTLAPIVFLAGGASPLRRRTHARAHVLTFSLATAHASLRTRPRAPESSPTAPPAAAQKLKKPKPASMTSSAGNFSALGPRWSDAECAAFFDAFLANRAKREREDGVRFSAVPPLPRGPRSRHALPGGPRGCARRFST